MRKHRKRGQNRETSGKQWETLKNRGKQEITWENREKSKQTGKT